MSQPEKETKKQDLEEIQDFISSRRDVKEWKRGEAVKLRMLGLSYIEIETRLSGSTSFIAKTIKK